MKVDVVRSSTIVRTARVLQLEGLFDVPPSAKSQERWTADLPLEDRDWSIGAIVGPSGAGKSTLARELFGQAVVEGHDWPSDKSVVDGFPAGMSIKDITALLSSVGFSSPPAWLRPFGVLSTGQQFRVMLYEGA
jgi:ATPase subunit of ABC transporter with duplicated ATPase domains